MAVNKMLVGTACVVVSAGAIAGGLWLRASQAPLAMPANVDEALAGLESDAYAKMDPQRRRQYAVEAGKLMRELPEDERRRLWEQMRDDEEMREAMQQARQDMFDEMIREQARSGGMERPDWGRRGGDRPRFDPDEMTDEQRERMEEMRERMRERIANQLKDTWDSGDAQSSGLRQEFFKNMGRGGRSG
jgi:hypothetical protein